MYLGSADGRTGISFAGLGFPSRPAPLNPSFKLFTTARHTRLGEEVEEASPCNTTVISEAEVGNIDPQKQKVSILTAKLPEPDTWIGKHT